MFWKKPLTNEQENITDMAHTSPSDPYKAEPIKQPAPAIKDEPVANKFGKVRSALSAGTVIQGKLSFDTPVRIDGKLTGEVFSSETLIVGTTGTVDAQIEVASLVVMGQVRGNIKASHRIDLMAGGRIDGNVNTPIFRMDETASFTGKCSMPAPNASSKKPTIIIEEEDLELGSTSTSDASDKDKKEQELHA